MPLQPFQQRVVEEKAELDGKIERLVEFIQSSPQFSNLPTEERGRLMRQAVIMRSYSEVLAERIAAF